MNTIKPGPVNDLMACDVCINEIPVDEAKNEEAVDYVIYYYGLECYSQWVSQVQKKDH